MVSVYYIVIMRNFLMTMDKALEESAFMDGAGYLRVIARIVVPLAKPVIATVMLWTAVGHWNEWFHALVFIRSRRKIVLQLLLRQMLELTYTETDGLSAFARLEKAEVVSSTVRAAITLVTIGPIVLVYPFAQRYFIKGIMVGSLKG
jgi:putative aldouronate transport system permease protein